MDKEQSCYQHEFPLVFTSYWQAGCKDEFRLIVLSAPLAWINIFELESGAETKHFLGFVFRRHPSRLLMGLGLGS